VGGDRIPIEAPPTPNPSPPLRGGRGDSRHDRDSIKDPGKRQNQKRNHCELISVIPGIPVDPHL